MTCRAALLLCLLLLPLGAADFVKDVQPVLQKRCVACHGAALQTNGLRLDRREDALKGGYSGAVIVPGDRQKSKLFQMVSGRVEGKLMPPGGGPLTPEQLEKLGQWIDDGAKWPESASASAAPSPARPKPWSFLPVRKLAPPSVRNPAWIRNPIDAFILSRLEKEGLAPSPEAGRAPLLRRLHLDLTGLPPAPEELRAFLADKSPKAYERAVDTLLASPHYGERWAMPWLDQARFADSDGFEKDSRRPHAWRYRHWVINALNANMPFDRFTVEQLAGDLLPGATVEQRVATGFQRNTLTNREGGINEQQLRYEQLVDRASTVGTVWLGLTTGCAQCHDHKYDPISQKEFYQLMAFFNQADEKDIEAPLEGEYGPFLSSFNAYYRARNQLLADYKIPEVQPGWEVQMLKAADQPGKYTDLDVAFDTVEKLVDHGERMLRTPPAKRTRYEADALTDHLIEWYHQVVGGDKYKALKYKELKTKLAELRAGFPDLSQAQTLEESAQARKAYVYLRGDWKQKGIEVEPGTPASLPPLPASNEPPRLRLARWLVARENPLTPRVAVNRVWQEFFGQGLVVTAEDFGTQGTPPSHTELLDWLAADFVESGWNLKALQKKIVLSAAYRQASATREDLQQRDPNNTLLARQSAHRLSAELIRDSALVASGLLNPAVGGKSIQPYLPESVVKLAFGNNDWVKWDGSNGPERYRRAVYIHFQRTIPYPLLANFDAPERSVPACRRRRSNTPLQALNLLNDPVFLEMAKGLAARILRESAPEFDARLGNAYRWVLARDPEPDERQRLAQYLQQQRVILDKDAKAMTALAPPGTAPEARLEAAAWTGLSRVLLNLDEFLTRE